MAMTAREALVRRRPVTAYFALTFAISWGGVLALLGPGGVPDGREAFARVIPYAIAVMLLGPSLAGLFQTAFLDGRMGLRTMLARLLHWRVGARWYAVALLLAPLVSLAILLALSLTSPVFVPGLIATDDKAGRLAFGLTAALVTGVLEELGWTGFATPRLRARYSILTTGLIIGVVWGAWHIIGNAFIASGTYAGDLSLPMFLAARTLGLLVGGLPAYRVLMVWVYDRTGSLLVAMLMHVSLTAATLTLEPLAITGTDLLLYDLVSTLVWWGIVSVLAVATQGTLTEPTREARAA
jgi:uncharacterized protein